MPDLAELTGCGKSTVNRILKSDLKMSKASPRLSSERKMRNFNM